MNNAAPTPTGVTLQFPGFTVDPGAGGNVLARTVILLMLLI